MVRPVPPSGGAHEAVAVAQTLAATICPVVEARDRFWQGSAANVLAGVLLWISDHPTEQKTLARAREIITQRRADFNFLLVALDRLAEVQCV